MSVIKMQIPSNEKKALTMWAPMLTFTTQGLGSFLVHTERDPETTKDIPPQTRYPEYPRTAQPYSSLLIDERMCIRPMMIWIAPSVMVSSSMNFLESNVEKAWKDQFH